MISNNKKIRNGIKKVLFAIGLAFTGPILFVLGFGQKESNTIQILLIIIGFLLMIGCVIFGVIGIRKILAGFFEESSE